MDEESEVNNYKDGDIVWVKLGPSWWPSQVQDLDKLPPDVGDFKKRPLVVVKFFEEDTYEFVKNWKNIYPYNCEKKNDFIKKGMNAFRAKAAHMEKFPKDVSAAEVIVGGNPDILSDPAFLPKKKVNYDDIFGTPSSKATSVSKMKAKDKRKNIAKKDCNRDISYVTHRRFLLGSKLGSDAFESMVWPQFPGKDRILTEEDDSMSDEEPDKELICISCSFTTKRLEVMIIHKKSRANCSSFKTSKKRLSSQKLKKEKTKKPRNKRRSSPFDLISEDISDSPKEKKRKVKKYVKKGKPKPDEPITSTDIRSDLLAEWDESDLDDLSTVQQSSLVSELSHSSTSIETMDSTMHESHPCMVFKSETEKRKIPEEKKSIKGEEIENDKQNTYEKISSLKNGEENKSESRLNDEMNEIVSTLASVKSTHETQVKDTGNAKKVDVDKKAELHKDIQQAIKSCFDFDEDDEEELPIIATTTTGRKIPRIIPITERRRTEDLLETLTEGDAEDRDDILKTSENFNQLHTKEKKNELDDAFKELMEITAVPDLPNVENSLKAEQNFHCVKTIKFPDKPSLSGQSSPVTDKYEKSDVSETATKLTNPKKRFVKSFEDFENEIRRKGELEDQMKIDKEQVENAPKTTRSPITELDQMKSKIMSKIIEVAKINEDSKKKIMSKMNAKKFKKIEANSPPSSEILSYYSSSESVDSKIPDNLDVMRVIFGSPQKDRTIHKPHRSKILESYMNDKNKADSQSGQDKAKIKLGTLDASTSVNTSLLPPIQLHSEQKGNAITSQLQIKTENMPVFTVGEGMKRVVPPKKNIWSRRLSHPKKDKIMSVNIEESSLASENLTGLNLTPAVPVPESSSSSTKNEVFGMSSQEMEDCTKDIVKSDPVKEYKSQELTKINLPADVTSNSPYIQVDALNHETNLSNPTTSVFPEDKSEHNYKDGAEIEDKLLIQQSIPVNENMENREQSLRVTDNVKNTDETEISEPPFQLENPEGNSEPMESSDKKASDPYQASPCLQLDYDSYNVQMTDPCSLNSFSMSTKEEFSSVEKASVFLPEDAICSPPRSNKKRKKSKSFSDEEILPKSPSIDDSLFLFEKRKKEDAQDSKEQEISTENHLVLDPEVISEHKSSPQQGTTKECMTVLEEGEAVPQEQEVLDRISQVEITVEKKEVNVLDTDTAENISKTDVMNKGDSFTAEEETVATANEVMTLEHEQIVSPNTDISTEVHTDRIGEDILPKCRVGSVDQSNAIEEKGHRINEEIQQSTLTQKRIITETNTGIVQKQLSELEQATELSKNLADQAGARDKVIESDADKVTSTNVLVSDELSRNQIHIVETKKNTEFQKDVESNSSEGIIQEESIFLGKRTSHIEETVCVTEKNSIEESYQKIVTVDDKICTENVPSESDVLGKNDSQEVLDFGSHTFPRDEQDTAETTETPMLAYRADDVVDKVIDPGKQEFLTEDSKGMKQDTAAACNLDEKIVDEPVAKEKTPSFLKECNEVKPAEIHDDNHGLEVGKTKKVTDEFVEPEHVTKDDVNLGKKSDILGQDLGVVDGMETKKLDDKNYNSQCSVDGDGHEKIHNLEIEYADNTSSDGFKFSIQTNLTNFSSREEISAMALATLAEIKSDLENSDSSASVDKLPTSIKANNESNDKDLPEPELVPIEGNLTVVSEKDLADCQVEITSRQVISSKKPMVLSNFSVDYSDTTNESTGTNDTLTDVSKYFDPRGTEFTSKAIMKEVKSIGNKKESKYERCELLDILEGNSDMDKKAKEVLPAKIMVDDFCDFEDHIPSQIVCAKKLKQDKEDALKEEALKEGTKPRFGKERNHRSSIMSTTSKLLERLSEANTDKSEANKSSKESVTPKKRSVKPKSWANANLTKPIVSEQNIKPSNDLTKIKSKQAFSDIEDVEAFVIPKDLKRQTTGKAEEAVTEGKSAVDSKCSKSGKAKILQQTIITPAGEIIQPVSNTTQDDNIFDINSMPIVLSDEILTPESIENMPIVISGEPALTNSITQEKILVTTVGKKPIRNKIIAKIGTSTPPALVSQSGVKPLSITPKQTKVTPRILQTSSNKLQKQCSPVLPEISKPAKYIIVPQSVSLPTLTKTVTKKGPIKKGSVSPGVTQKVPAAVQELGGNKIMILTNQQGQQQRLLLTPAQQKILGFQSTGTSIATKTVVKGNVAKTLVTSKGIPGTSLTETTLSSIHLSNKSSGLVTQKLLIPSTNPEASTSQQVLGTTISSRVSKGGVTKRFTLTNQKATSSTKNQKTILIKNQHGQTVKKVQGTDEDLEKQVAEQLEAIRASSAMKLGSQTKVSEISVHKPPAKPLTKRSYPKKGDVKPKAAESQAISKAESFVNVTSVQVKNADVNSLPTESKITSKSSIPSEPKHQPERPLNQLVIQDALGNQTTITEGQILALPSETVDGHPQSYMLVTLDESGNLTPLNNEALMSLDPNLGSDLSNMVLQIEQPNALTGNPIHQPLAQPAVVKTNKNSEPPKLQTDVIERQVVANVVPLAVPAAPPVPKMSDAPPLVESSGLVRSVIPSTNGESGQQLIISGDPIATQKFLESLSEGTTNIANILSSAESNSFVIHADGQEILINTNSDNQMLLPNESTEAGGNPVFATQLNKNQDILAAALADTDVFPQDQRSPQSKLTSQLSPNNALYPINVGSVLETSLTLNSPIMTPLEVPSTNNKKIPDEEADILTRVPKNVDLPITITDPNISQTVANQQVLMGTELQANLELALPIVESRSASKEMSSPSFNNYSLPTLDESVEINQKSFSSSMPLLNEDIEETSLAQNKSIIKVTNMEVEVEIPSNGDNSKMDLKGETSANSESQNTFPEDDDEEGRFTLGGEMCSSLSEPPPEMFDITDVNQPYIMKSHNHSSLQSTPEPSDHTSKDGDTTDVSTLAESSNDSCEIPIQPQIIAKSQNLEAFNG